MSASASFCEYKITLKDVFDLWQTQMSIQTTRRNQKSKALDHSRKHKMIHYAYKWTQHKLNMKNAEKQHLGRPTVNPGRPKKEENPYTSVRSTHRPFRSLKMKNSAYQSVRSTYMATRST